MLRAAGFTLAGLILALAVAWVLLYREGGRLRADLAELRQSRAELAELAEPPEWTDPELDRLGRRFWS